MEEFQRFEMQIGKEKIKTLENSSVAIFGVGGVGSFVAETLARSGIGQFYIIDGDTIDLTNINRQLYALHSTIGKSKVEICKQRILDINAKAVVQTFNCFFRNESDAVIPYNFVDYFIDAVDDLDAKITIVQIAKKYNKNVICSMGMGNKLDSSKLQIADISKTHTCRLAKKFRTELKKLSISDVKVIFSSETPLELKDCDKTIISSNAFVPSVAGIMMASEVIKDLIKK